MFMLTYFNRYTNHHVLHSTHMRSSFTPTGRTLSHDSYLRRSASKASPLLYLLTYLLPTFTCSPTYYLPLLAHLPTTYPPLQGHGRAAGGAPNPNPNPNPGLNPNPDPNPKQDTGELQEAQQYCSRLLDIGGQVKG